MANIFGRFLNRVTRSDKVDKNILNAFNKAFYEYIGGQGARYDYDRAEYLEKGYGINPDVYAIISQQADKLKSIPFYIHDVKDKKSRSDLKQLDLATKGNPSIPQLKRKIQLKAEAFQNDTLPFPMDQPNPNQTWADIWALYEVFMQTTGNFYLYKVTPDEGVNKDVPQQVHVLPSHLMEIVLKENADLIEEENVIDHYMLTEGSQFVTFDTDDVIHIKLPNPFFDFEGSHLYGLSPVKSILRNIESSNDALDQNVKTMKNGGVFGFIHAKDGKTPLHPEQAMQIKEKLRQMDGDPSRLSNIAGASFPLAFTKLSLSTDELKPFDFLSYDQKTIANVLQWDVLLLNNKEASTYNNLQTAQRNVVINHIIPSLKLLEEALNKEFIKLFKGYENAEIEWDYTELPEMQKNVKELIEGYSGAFLTPNEKRELVSYERLEVEGMDTPWIDGNKRKIDEAGLSDFELDQAFGDA